MAETRLPTYEQAEVDREQGRASALAMFIYEQTPRSRQLEGPWRERLANVVDETAYATRADLARKVLEVVDLPSLRELFIREGIEVRD